MINTLRRKKVGITVGSLWFHRLDQWDFDCRPWLCVHWITPDSSSRVFCVWSRGIQIGRHFTLSNKAIGYKHHIYRWGRGWWKVKD
jgi:hypothetical protein